MEKLDSRKIITAPIFWDEKVDLDNLDNLKEAKPIFIFETINTIFKANSLSEVCQLYKKSNDNSEVINITKVG